MFFDNAKGDKANNLRAGYFARKMAVRFRKIFSELDRKSWLKPYTTGQSSKGPAYQFFFMEGESKNDNNKRQRFSYRYDPRLFEALQSVCDNKALKSNFTDLKATLSDTNSNVPQDSVRFIHLGYAIPEPNKVYVREGHTLVCGITGNSGKTVCIEGLISRWPDNTDRKKKVISFITKQENIFENFRRIRPYINTKPNPDFLAQVVENMLMKKKRPQISTKINLTLAELCHGAETLDQVLKNTSKMLKELKKKNAVRDKLKEDVCIVLRYCLSNIFPQKGRMNPSAAIYTRSNTINSDFEIAENIEFKEDENNNVVINLSSFSDEVRTLVIGSVAYEILKDHQDIVLVIPDASAIFDINGYSLGRLQVESLISDGPKNRNHVMIESLDIESVPLQVRLQMATILLGHQTWGDEAKLETRALRDLARHMWNSRPKVAVEKPFLTRVDIQMLKRGQFCAFPSYVENNGIMNKAGILTKVFAVPS